MDHQIYFCVIHPEEGLTLEMSALKLFRGQFTLSTQLIILNYPIILSHQRNTTIFSENLPPLLLLSLSQAYSFTLKLMVFQDLKYCCDPPFVVHYTFPIVLERRICLTIEAPLVAWCT